MHGGLGGGVGGFVALMVPPHSRPLPNMAAATR